VFRRLIAVLAAMGAGLMFIVAAFFYFFNGLSPSHPGVLAHLGLALVLAAMAGVMFVAHMFIKRVLEPLKELGEGVDRLGAGDLSVSVPSRTNDELGRLATAFNDMVGRVRDMISSRDRLLLDVSHELRSPVTRLRVALELLPAGAQRDAMIEDVLEMQRMIEGLLEMERLRSGHGLVRAEHDIVALIHEVARSFAGSAPGVRVVTGTESIPAGVDAEKLRIALRNIIENAVKYSLPDSAAVEVSAAHEGSAVVIRVRDHGTGIPDADKSRVFEPFFRSDPSRSRKTGGYGLGLSLAKRIIDAHGGTITVRDAAPAGTLIEITLRP
jgi:signal transduction histidine kinase